MPTIQVPLATWLGMTRDERDQAFISAGFNPSVPTVDNGTDTSFVRFRQQDLLPDQIPGSVASPPRGAVAPQNISPTGFDVFEPILTTGGLQAGDDLRDFVSPVSLIDPNAITDEFGVPAPPGEPFGGAAIAIAGRALRLIVGGGGGRLTAATWNSLPSLVRSTLTQIGIGVGALIAFNGDIPFITLPGQGASVEPFIGPVLTNRPVDIQVGAMSANPLQGVQVVGSWVANGVTFFRLADGKLAVQNKKGRWKVWRPRKPIVLYADGASSLKTMLRADKALNKQAKKIAAMLNRRAPRKAKALKTAHPAVLLPSAGHVIDV